MSITPDHPVAAVNRPPRTQLPVWTAPDEVPRHLGPTTLALGQFDGVHRGHQQLLAAARRAADQRGIAAGVVTFDQHTSTVLAPGREPARLTSLDTKLELLRAHGMDFAVVLPARRDVLGKPALRFVSVLLLDALDARTIVVGPDYRFGSGARGNPDLLAELTRNRGVDVVVMDELTHDGERISSTRVRGALGAGHVDLAADLLGRNHRTATVTCVPGDGTVVLDLDRCAARPAHGRYAVRVHAPGDPFPGPAELTLTADGAAVLTSAPGLQPGDAVVIEFRASSSSANPT